jgi:hypothetical protein
LQRALLGSTSTTPTRTPCDAVGESLALQRLSVRQPDLAQSLAVVRVRLPAGDLAVTHLDDPGGRYVELSPATRAASVRATRCAGGERRSTVTRLKDACMPATFPKRLKGLEPSTFCMASSADFGQTYTVFPANHTLFLSLHGRRQFARNLRHYSRDWANEIAHWPNHIGLVTREERRVARGGQALVKRAWVSSTPMVSGRAPRVTGRSWR